MAIAKATIPGLINDTEYGVRVFVEGKYGYQTALEGATATATPRAGQPAGDLSVGAIVKIIEGGTPTDYIVVHQGLPSDMYDESCNGTWLLRKDVLEKRQWHSSATNDWANSTLKAYLDGTFLARFESSFQGAIKQVKIPYRPGSGAGSNINSRENGLPCKTFLLSARETGGSKNSYAIDGVKLDYFESGESTSANNKRIACYKSTAVTYWTRTATTDRSLIYNNATVEKNGQFDYTGISGNLCGVRPACIIPSNMLFSLEPNPDGSYSPIL